MSAGAISVFSPAAQVASAASTSGEFDLSKRGWTNILLEIGTMSTAMNVTIWASTESGGTFRPVYHPTINSATVATNIYTITGAGTNGGIAPIPTGFQFFKVVLTGVVSGGATFKAICSD
jgi:hypothetical protein